MSASPVARQIISQAIPVTRRVAVNHESDLPNDLSSTPGGSLFSTTPGGTRVYYDRNFLLSMRNSPLARTPPANLPVIRGVTVPNIQPTEAIQEEDNDKFEELHDDEDTRLANSGAIRENTGITVSSSPPKDKDDDAQFQLDL